MKDVTLFAESPPNTWSRGTLGDCRHEPERESLRLPDMPASRYAPRADMAGPGRRGEVPFDEAGAAPVGGDTRRVRVPGG